MVNIHPAPPFSLDLTAWAQHRIASNKVDRWDGRTFRRVLTIGHRAFEVFIEQPGPGQPLHVRWEGIGFGAERKAVLLPMLSRMLGFSLRMEGWAERVASDSRLSQLVGRDGLGLKPPRFPSVFEALVNAYTCQQISFKVGMTMLNRMCERYGPRYGESFGFPRPSDLVSCHVDDLRAMGLSARKAENVLDLARRLVEGTLNFEPMTALGDDELIETLKELPGVGSWTAEYVAVRGFGRLDVIPAGDAAVQVAAQAWLGLDTRPDPDRLRALLAEWSPFHGMLYFHLLRSLRVSPHISHCNL